MARCLMDLPIELLELILTWVWNLCADARQRSTEFCNLRATCKLLQQLVDPTLYRQPTFEDRRRLNKFLQCTRDRPHLLSMVKGAFLKISSDDTSQIPLGLQQLPRLQLISLNINAKYPSDALSPRFDVFQSLEQCIINVRPGIIDLLSDAPAQQMPITLRIEQLHPILASPKLQRLSLCGINITGHCVFEKLPSFALLSIREAEGCFDIAEAIRSVRSPHMLKIDCGDDDPSSANRRIIDTFAKDIRWLAYSCHPRDPTDPRGPFSLQHCVQLQQLHIRADLLGPIFPSPESAEYAPSVVDPQPVMSFPASLRYLGIHIQSEFIYRPAFYAILSRMVDRRVHIFPGLQTLLIQCWEAPLPEPSDPPPKPYTPDNFGAWVLLLNNNCAALRWSHNRVAPFESDAIPDEGSETRECQRLRSLCEDHGIEFKTGIVHRCLDIEERFVPGIEC